MRVLLVSYAERTQALPMVPVGWALRCAGHDVLFATQPELVEDVADSGLPVIGVGRSLPLYRLWQHAEAAGDPDGPLDLADPDADVPWPVLLEGYRENVQWWWRTANEPMVADLVRLCRQWKPDLVVWEAVTYAGAVAARATGAAHVRFLWTADVFARMRERFLAARPAGDTADPLAEWLGECAGRFGTDFAEELVTGQATITFLPPSLRTADSAQVRYLPVRHVPYVHRSVLPRWLWDPPERPLVCLTLGTSAVERFGRYVVPVADLLAGLAELEADIVATIPAQEQEKLGPVPPNVRLEEYVPLDAIAPHCAAVANHGGPGTVGTMLVHGVPQLVVPEEFDAPLLARLLAATGAAIALTPEEADPATVREATARLLTDPVHRAAAAALRDEARAMPTPREIVRDLEQLARR